MKADSIISKNIIFTNNMRFIEKNYYYLQVLFFVMGIVGWIFNFDKLIPTIYSILCYIASAGLIGINVLKLKWVKEKRFKWGLNVSFPQLAFYGLLVFLLYFRFFGTVHAGIPVRLFAVVLTLTLLLDTFTKENKYHK